MISKNQLKLIRALGQKKQRKQHGQFLVQGEKNVLELLKSDLNIHQVFASEAFVNEHQQLLQLVDCTVASESELSKASTLSTNNSAIAVVTTPNIQITDDEIAQIKGIQLALDGVSDPGNLGTIIRVADWYGIHQIVCSEDCADPYNPKTISATMGAFTRVKVVQCNLANCFKQTNLPGYGAYLGGENVHKTQFPQDMILLMGSESHGIRAQASEHVTNKITIPNFGGSESLNVAMASGIILDNIFRQLF